MGSQWNRSGTLLDNSGRESSTRLEKPHVERSFHDHKVNRVMVYLQDGQQRFEYQDGRKPVVFDWKAGEVKWSPARVCIHRKWSATSRSTSSKWN